MIVPRARQIAALVASALFVAACEAGPPPATPPIIPGTVSAPREVNIIAKDWQFLPDPVDLVAGESVLLHIVNGGLEIHEVVIGDAAVQDAWEAAEAATAEHPPGPTPVVSVPPGVAGLRVVVASGQRVDVSWTVPAGAGTWWARADWWSAATSPATGRKEWLPQSGSCGPFQTRELAGGTLRVRAGVGSGALRGEDVHDLCDRRAVHRCARPVVRLGLPGGLHPLRRRRRPEAVHRPERVHRLRRLRARVPGERDLPRGVAAPPSGRSYTAIDAIWYTDKAAARAATDAEKPSA